MEMVACLRESYRMQVHKVLADAPRECFGMDRDNVMLGQFCVRSMTINRCTKAAEDFCIESKRAGEK